MQLTLLRHAPLPLCHQKRYNGWSDIPIDPNLFDHQKVAHLKKQQFDLIYSSDLKRCIQTLSLIFEEQEIATTMALREVKFKEEIEGKSFEEIKKLATFRPHYLESEILWHHYICEESQEAFHQRLNEFLQQLPKKKKILICSHAGAIRAIMHLLEASTATNIEYLDSTTIDWK
jgi:broad specificity phosphatase PhoE